MHALPASDHYYHIVTQFYINRAMIKMLIALCHRLKSWNVYSHACPPLRHGGSMLRLHLTLMIFLLYNSYSLGKLSDMYLDVLASAHILFPLDVPTYTFYKVLTHTSSALMFHASIASKTDSASPPFSQNQSVDAKHFWQITIALDALGTPLVTTVRSLASPPQNGHGFKSDMVILLRWLCEHDFFVSPEQQRQHS